ncbi:MAG: alpha/beta fold hydrolase [Micromonosporaceae bacterium]
MSHTLEPALRVGAGEPVLLLHPFSLSHHVWRTVADRLADRCDVLAPTLPGHCGGPRLHARQVSVAAIADGVETILDDAGWETCHVVGNSLGGWVGFELARRGRARTVTAIAPAGGWRRFSYAELLIGTKFLALYPMLVIGAACGLRRWLRPVIKLMLRQVSHDVAAVSRADADHVFLASTRCPCYLPMIWAGLRDGGITGLDQVRCPVRLVFTDSDRLIPQRRYAPRFTTAFPDVDPVILRGVGHVPMLEAPELVADAIREHLDRHSASRAA